MRIVLSTTIQAVLRVPSRFHFADKVTRWLLLATAGTDEGNYVILKPLRSRLRIHCLILQNIKKRCEQKGDRVKRKTPK